MQLLEVRRAINWHTCAQSVYGIDSIGGNKRSVTQVSALQGRATASIGYPLGAQVNTGSSNCAAIN